MSKSTPIHTAEVASPELDKRIKESIAKAVPAMLARFFSSGGLVPSQEPPTKDVASSSPSNQTDEESPGPSHRGECFFSTEEEFELSSELLDLTTKAFTKPLTKGKWKELSANYPPSPPPPENQGGLHFDDGLAGQQGPSLTVTRPILAVLMLLDSPPNEK